MDRFPEHIVFKFEWRKYQKRVLDELDQHLEDDHLHIVAPPGSGKTILGLEVMLRLNKPTLILAPTITIRNQWVQRFCELFVQSKEIPSWISKDIKNPKLLTVSTYQGLHAAVEVVKDLSEEAKTQKANVFEILQAHQIGTIVVDEAHHLKSAWWRSLTELKAALSPTIVGLTATPPYDVSPSEWERYIELNGPVDAEISVPELVVEEDLCPHQDYIYFSTPTKDESEKILDYRKKIDLIFNEIKSDQYLINYVSSLPFIKEPEEHLEWIYSHIEKYSAILIYLNSTGKKITDHHLEVVGNSQISIPEFNHEWAEVLLNFSLYESFQDQQIDLKYQEQFTARLKRMGLVENKTIKLGNNKKVQAYLNASISKLNSIVEIVQFEHDQLKSDLRLVVLSDFIRKEFLVNSSKNEVELNKIGIVPIFEKLRRAGGSKLGVLTGSIIIIPSSAEACFREISKKYGVNQIATEALPYDDQYLIVKTNDQIKHDIVHIVTQVFEKGEIEVLVGTKSLLGEGWDAPSINALILASFVGSYVLSNQMRGRAIRTERLNQNKTGNIWHLVCVDPGTTESGEDFELLKRRFKSFVGVSLDEDLSIENGIGRMRLPVHFSSKLQVEKANERMLRVAGNRDDLNLRWKEALSKGQILIEEIKVPFSEEVKDFYAAETMYFRKTIAFLIAGVISGLIGFAHVLTESLIRSAGKIKSIDDVIIVVSVVGILFMLLFGGLMFKTLKLYLKFRDISKDIEQICHALLNSLIHFGHVRTDRSKLIIKTSMDQSGAVFCHLEGASTYEKALFISSLHEIISTVKNPRYIIIRKNNIFTFIKQKDYHSVPEILGRQKKTANYFAQQWYDLVGNCDLIYTRTIEGRRMILISRMNSLASNFEKKSQRVNRWK